MRLVSWTWAAERPGVDSIDRSCCGALLSDTYTYGDVCNVFLIVQADVLYGQVGAAIETVDTTSDDID